MGIRNCIKLPLGFLGFITLIPKQKEKKQEKDEVLIYITIVLKQLKKIKYPQKKEEAMLCFACLQSFFWWLTFATGQQQKNEHGKGPKDSFRKKLLKVVLKFAISRHLFLTCCQKPILCCHHSNPEKKISFQKQTFAQTSTKDSHQISILQTSKPISSFQSVQIRFLCIMFVCGVFFPFPAKLTNLGSYWTYQGLQQLLDKKAKVTADYSFNTSSHQLCMSLLLTIDIYSYCTLQIGVRGK